MISSDAQRLKGQSAQKGGMLKKVDVWGMSVESCCPVKLF